MYIYIYIYSYICQYIHTYIQSRVNKNITPASFTLAAHAMHTPVITSHPQYPRVNAGDLGDDVNIIEIHTQIHTIKWQYNIMSYTYDYKWYHLIIYADNIHTSGNVKGKNVLLKRDKCVHGGKGKKHEVRIDHNKAKLGQLGVVQNEK